MRQSGNGLISPLEQASGHPSREINCVKRVTLATKHLFKYQTSAEHQQKVTFDVTFAQYYTRKLTKNITENQHMKKK